MNDRIQQLSDGELFKLCKKYGSITLKYRNKFIGLLPEVFKRRVFEKKGFSSIFEFAAKLAGLSQEQVRRVLNLEERFVKMPVLREMLVSGEVSVSKLAKVASLATPENQEELALHVRLLPRSALETLARDEKLRRSGTPAAEYQNCLIEAKNEAKSVPGNTHPQQNLENTTGGDGKMGNSFLEIGNLGLSQEILQKLSELKRRGIDINSLLLEFLEKRELEIEQEKEELSQNCESTDSRYIPAAVRNLLKKEYGEKCSIETCEKPSQEIHHTQRFSLSQNHNPKFLALLCKEHHDIAHTVDWRFHDARLRAVG